MSWCLAPRRVRRVHGTTGRVLWATAQQGGRGREPSTEHVLVPGTWSWPFKAGGTLMGRFRDALAAPGLGAIAEVKRRSPSAGDLRPDADPARLAAQFTSAGAAAISILVDERFGGSFEDLKAARAATTAPLLAKGFFTEELELLKVKVAGADAVLILLRDVDDQRAAALMSYARELGLETL